VGVASRWVWLQGGCCCKVGAAIRWVLLQGRCCYKVGAVARWVLLQGGCSCEVVPGKIYQWFIFKCEDTIYKNLFNRDFNDAHFILTLKFK